jgi:arylsulfatase A-like enzyme
MKGIILLAVFCAVSLSSIAQLKGKPGNSGISGKPNIILILTDDAGYADFSFQSDRLIPTPHIDRIAEQGVKFTNGYVTGAVCSPSRAGILTGINQAEFGHVYNFIKGVQYNIPVDSFGLPVSEKLVGQYLKPLGYSTGIIGKWHEGFAKRFYPNERGFDYFWGFLWGSSPYFTGSAKQVEENTRPIAADSIPYMTDAIGNESVKFIREHTDAPFFLYVSFNAPHTPMQAKPEVLAQFKDRFKPEGRAINAAMTWSIDENVGKILALLDELALTDNTLIVFTNDNGGQVTYSFTDNYPLRGMKGDVYEGGIRVPMAIMWRKKIKPAMVCDIPVSTLDLIPTFLAAAGEDPGHYPRLEGADLIRLIHHRTPDRPFFWYVGLEKGAVRAGDYKLVCNPGNSPELYNLKNDIGESVDLYEKEPTTASGLETLYRNWKDKLPVPAWIPLKKEDQINIH